MNSVQIESAIKCITSSCECVQKHPVEVSDKLACSNMMYNIIYKAAKMVLTAQLLSSRTFSPLSLVQQNRKANWLTPKDLCLEE